MEREEILDEIRRTAEENGGKPLGKRRFLRLTGITEWEFGKHWLRYSDALREVGFKPNEWTVARDDDFVIGKYLELTRKLGHVPTQGEMRLERIADPSYPAVKVFKRFGSKNERIGKALSYCRERSDYEDVVAILEAAYVPSSESSEDGADTARPNGPYGFVYLVRGHPGECKIGRTNLVDRRVSELGATFPVEQTLVHEIKTDDPVGVEAYWHARFADKRMRGEWFKLTAADVKAFRRWRRIF